MSDDVLLKEIKAGRKEALDTLYTRYRDSFIQRLVSNHRCTVEQATEIYQIAIVIVHDNITSGKLNTLNSENSLRAYIFQIGVYKYKDWRRQQLKITDFPENYLGETDESDITKGTERIEREERQLEQLGFMQTALKQLGEPCSSILELFYYEDKSMNEIAEELNYSNTNTTKNMKYKCLRRLKQAFAKISKNY